MNETLTARESLRRIYISAYATLVGQARNKQLAELTKIRKRWARNLAYEVRLPLIGPARDSRLAHSTSVINSCDTFIANDRCRPFSGLQRSGANLLRPPCD